MKKVTVLGGGMVGSAIAEDLSENYEVTICDINDNVIKVSQPDFFVAQSNFNYKDVRRSISHNTVLFLQHWL